MPTISPAIKIRMYSQPTEISDMVSSIREWNKLEHTSRFSLIIYINILNSPINQIFHYRLKTFSVHWFIQQEGIDLRVHIKLIKEREISGGSFPNHKQIYPAGRNQLQLKDRKSTRLNASHS